jgi:hypothetical protein
MLGAVDLPSDNSESINDAASAQTRGSFSISICGLVNIRAYQGKSSQLIG